MLPLRFNDGREVPGERIGEAVEEIAEYFGSVSLETQTIEGRWKATLEQLELWMVSYRIEIE
jgi:hypothetical protein